MWDLYNNDYDQAGSYFGAQEANRSLHAIYAWYLYVGRGYTHDPMMHGPFLFHFAALLYSLFGDSEVTFRLAKLVEEFELPDDAEPPPVFRA